MRIIQLIPGSGNAFYCENCLRDGTLFRALRKQGHDVDRVPLYLPIATNEFDHDPDEAVFFGGINVYLQQKSALFRKTPRWIDRIFDAPGLLKWAAGMGGMTDAEELGETTISMLRGEEGRQVKELERLVVRLVSGQRPDVVHLSNALLLGMVRRIKQELGVPVICSLQDEDIWVDALPETQRDAVWEILAERAADVDAFIAVSHYYKDLMCERLRVPAERIHVVYSGISLEGYRESDLPTDPPVIGFLERECREKGLGVLIDAFLILKKNGKVPGLKLRVAGGNLVEDRPFLKEMHQRLDSAGLSEDVEFLPNLSYEERLAFLQSLSIMSVPAEHREAFGVYIIEALASGVPVVQPNQGAFPELLDLTGGGVLYEPNEPHVLADAMEKLLLYPESARELGRRGRKAVFEKFSVEGMSQKVLKVMETVLADRRSPAEVRLTDPIFRA